MLPRARCRRQTAGKQFKAEKVKEKLRAAAQSAVQFFRGISSCQLSIAIPARKPLVTENPSTLRSCRMRTAG
jgi:hypothetical protein